MRNYSIGVVENTSGGTGTNFGGFIGGVATVDVGPVYYEHNYWDSQYSGINQGAAYATPYTTAQMQVQGNYTRRLLGLYGRHGRLGASHGKLQLSLQSMGSWIRPL